MWPPEGGDSALVREGTDVVWTTLAWFGCEQKAWSQVPGQEWGPHQTLRARLASYLLFRGLFWLREDVA